MFASAAPSRHRRGAASGLGALLYGGFVPPSMSDHGHAPADHDEGEEPGRTTAPMQEFSTGQVTTGFLVLAVGLAVVFGLPLLL